MYWRTERKKLITAFLVVGGLYTVIMLLAKHGQDNSNGYSWNAGHPSQMGPVLVAWGLGALAVLGLWVGVIALNYMRKNRCSQCGTVTKSGSWVQVTDLESEGGTRKIFLCTADSNAYQHSLRMAEAMRIAQTEEQYSCPICHTGTMMAKVPEDVETEAFPVNRCGNCGAVLVTGDRDQKRLVYAKSVGYQLGLRKAEDDDIAGAVLSGVIAGSIAASVSSSFNAPGPSC